MKTLVRKVSLVTIAFFTIAAAAVVSVTGIQKAIRTEATGSVLYDYTSNTESGLTGAVAQTANWVLTDSNDPTQTFTFNVGKNTYASPNSTTFLGGTTGTALAGSSPGQFVYGTPSLKSLATTTNITNNKKLYGFRMNGGLDLTNYRDVTVTFSWSAGGAGTYTGFIAGSTTGSSESWSLLGAGKQAINCTVASSLGFTDTDNMALVGKTGVRFALIFGSGVTKLAMKNIKMVVTANPRKTLSSVSNGSLNVARDYHVSEALNLNAFDLTANYAYPTTSQTIYGSDSRISFSIDNFSSTISKTTYSFSTTGNKTLYYRLVDTTLTAGVVNTATASMTIDIGTRVITGLEVIDGNTTALYKYDLYTPSLSVYPLYDNATSHASFDAAFSPSDYTTSLAYGTMVSAGTYYNEITLIADTNIKKTLTVSVGSARNALTPSLSLSGQKTSFFVNDAFAIDTMTVTATWGVGGNTTPAYSASNADGTYNVSKTPGTVLSTVGTETITVTYYVNSVPATTTYAITVENRIYTFFNHAFSDGSEWGATATPVNGAITNREGTLTNSVSGWTSATTWVLNTTVNPADANNGAFSFTQDADLKPFFLRFGTATAGPTTVSFEGKNFPAITNPQNTLNGIARMTVDAEAGAAGTLTVSVAGIAPTSYAINYGTPTAGSTATTLAGQYCSYTFYFPYTIIGKIKVSFTNNATPKYLDLGNFSVIGYSLTLEKQVETFATMLNNTNTCSGTNYANLKVVYDYLVAKGVNGNLASYSMDLQPAVSGYSTPNALQLWDVYSTRYGSDGGATPLTTSDNIVMTDDVPTIVVISILGVLAVAGFFFNENKRKTE